VADTTAARPIRCCRRRGAAPRPPNGGGGGANPFWGLTVLGAHRKVGLDGDELVDRRFGGAGRLRRGRSGVFDSLGSTTQRGSSRTGEEGAAGAEVLQMRRDNGSDCGALRPLSCAREESSEGESGRGRAERGARVAMDAQRWTKQEEEAGVGTRLARRGSSSISR
jgi:hypothetical protein